MTKYILVGGYPRKTENGGKAFAGSLNELSHYKEDLPIVTPRRMSVCCVQTVRQLWMKEAPYCWKPVAVKT
jgi:hypothetical protein